MSMSKITGWLELILQLKEILQQSCRETLITAELQRYFAAEL